MRTYVTVYLSSEGGKASDIADKFKELGFSSTLGTHDFVYEWKDSKVSPAHVISFVDKVQSKLRNAGVMLHFTTLR